jgi:cytochrome c oxidase cbb3-type subunit 3
MVLPRGTGGYPGLGAAAAKTDLPLKVTIKMPSGPVLSGDVVSLDDFHVTFKDSTGALRTVTRNGDVPPVTITDPVQAHLDLLPKLTDKVMHDLTAYLATLK